MCLFSKGKTTYPAWDEERPFERRSSPERSHHNEKRTAKLPKDKHRDSHSRRSSSRNRHDDDYDRRRSDRDHGRSDDRRRNSQSHSHRQSRNSVRSEDSYDSIVERIRTLPVQRTIGTQSGGPVGMMQQRLR